MRHADEDITALEAARKNARGAKARLDEATEQGLVGDGANIISAAFGAGLTWGASLIRW